MLSVRPLSASFRSLLCADPPFHLQILGCCNIRCPDRNLDRNISYWRRTSGRRLSPVCFLSLTGTNCSFRLATLHRQSYSRAVPQFELPRRCVRASSSSRSSTSSRYRTAVHCACGHASGQWGALARMSTLDRLVFTAAMGRRTAWSWSWAMTVRKAEQNQPSQLKCSLQQRDRELSAARGGSTC